MSETEKVKKYIAEVETFHYITSVTDNKQYILKVLTPENAGKAMEIYREWGTDIAKKAIEKMPEIKYHIVEVSYRHDWSGYNAWKKIIADEPFTVVLHNKGYVGDNHYNGLKFIESKETEISEEIMELVKETDGSEPE